MSTPTTINREETSSVDTLYYETEMQHRKTTHQFNSVYIQRMCIRTAGAQQQQLSLEVKRETRIEGRGQRNGRYR